MFRDVFRHRRCIIPASLWKPPPTGKQPYRDGTVLPFADLWDEWHDPESGQRVKSCTIRQVLSGQFTIACWYCLSNFEM
jgi:putative SOS response-associated peptidase YedK